MADLQLLLSFPPDDVAKLSNKKYDEVLRGYVQRVDKLPQSAFLKQVNNQNILELLNPAINSIAYLYTLVEQVKSGSKDKNRLTALLDCTVIFLATFDPVQIRYSTISDVWLDLTTFAITNLHDLTPVTTALLRLDPSAGTFTTVHLRIVRAALNLGTPSAALPILDKNIHSLPTTPIKQHADEYLCDEDAVFITSKSGFTGKVAPEFLLEYYLLGATIYTALRQYSRARLFLEYVLLTPTTQHSASALQVEAYKQFALLGLLAQGKGYPLPRTHDSSVTKNIRACCKAYDALAESFEHRDLQKFRAEMETGMAVWHEDGNLRLVRECEQALLKWQVLDLGKRFAALPIGRVAAHVGFGDQEVLGWTLELIRSGQMSASITPADSGEAGDAVLRFHDTTAGKVGGEDLAAQTARIEELVKYIRAADVRLQLSKEYVDYAKRQKKLGPDAGDVIGDQMDLSWEGGGGIMGGSSGMGSTGFMGPISGGGGGGGMGLSGRIEGLDDGDEGGEEDIMGNY
ncbi:hypothetical protein LTR97_002518 [Elasticomyces elasticus]|uniref:COP9 signalosome complex subunit 3 N-terminal helical repeats domain-containing protein n=1 Tax=Elasticomyces elasticus TaxID=574655 RepID=A0AAN8A5I1_9PEZI|nr:hypothetical protein LTR97_002518 [Elasticomyces elasticus]